MSAAKNLDRWVWDMVIGLLKDEAEHSTLFWQNYKGEWIRSDWCPATALARVPQSVRDTAEILAELLPPPPDPGSSAPVSSADPVSPASPSRS